MPYPKIDKTLTIGKVLGNLNTNLPGMNVNGNYTIPKTDEERKLLHISAVELRRRRRAKHVEDFNNRNEIYKIRDVASPEEVVDRYEGYEKPSVIGISGYDPLLGIWPETVATFGGAGTLFKTGLWNLAKRVPTSQLGNYGRLYFVGNAFKNSFNGSVPKLVISPLIRTRVGDVEIDNPNLLYHLDRGNGAGSFSNQGAYVENGVLFPGVAKKEGLLGYSWWNEGKPYATSINGQPMTRLMTTTKDTPGMLLVRSQNYPIGQWTGSKGFVLPSEYVNSEGVNVSGSLYNWKSGYGYKKITQEPSTSLAFFERKPSKLNWSEKVGLPKEVRNRKVPQYTLENARQEALLFANKWGYELPENASLLLIEELYNLHNTFFRGVTTEQLENTRNRIAKELGINPEDLTKELYLLYVSTHAWPGNDRIWVTPMSHYGEMYGNGDMIGGGGLLSAVMRPWKTTKNIKQWPKEAEWQLGFKEDVNEPVLVPWVSNHPNAIRSLGALSEFLIKSPIIYRGLGQNFKGTLLQLLLYNKNQGKLGWIESLVGELPQEIIIEKQGGKMNIIDFLKNGSGIHIKKKNRGKFTKYCGGEVTDACIRKAKASGNPTLVKRATFADNARKWKHKFGGVVKAEEGTKINGWLKFGNFLNGDTGKWFINLGTNLGTNLISNLKKQEMIDNELEAAKKLEEAYEKDLFARNYNESLKELNDPSSIVNMFRAWLNASFYKDNPTTKWYNKRINILNNNNNNEGNILSGLGQTITDFITLLPKNPSQQ